MKKPDQGFAEALHSHDAQQKHSCTCTWTSPQCWAIFFVYVSYYKFHISVSWPGSVPATFHEYL